jgi:hypothetical protein
MALPIILTIVRSSISSITFLLGSRLLGQSPRNRDEQDRVIAVGKNEYFAGFSSCDDKDLGRSARRGYGSAGGGAI